MHASQLHASELQFNAINGPHMYVNIVIVPRSMLGNWMDVLRKWLREVNPVKFHGNADDSSNLKELTFDGLVMWCIRYH